MTPEQSSKKVRKFYAMLLSDFDAACEDYLSGDFMWENPLPEIIPFGGIYRGKDGMRRYFKALAEAIVMKPLNVTDVIAADNRVALVGVEKDTLVERTGKAYTMPFVHVVRLNDAGEICHVREYNDTVEMLKAFEAV